MKISVKNRMAQGKKKAVVATVATVPLFVENAFGSQYYGGVGTSSRSSRHKAQLSAGPIKFANVREGLTPFEDDGGAVCTRDAIHLCQKAYWNVPIFKQTIDIMAEFSNSEIKWEGGNKASRDFFKALSDKIGMWNLKDQFFREYYRSGHIYLLRFDGSLSKTDAKKLSQVYSEDIAEGASTKVRLPIRYMLLNPLDIRAGANISFSASNTFYKVLNRYEMERLKYPQTEAEKELYQSLSPKQKKDIKDGIAPMIPIDPERLHAVFYKKMDYEPVAVPMGYCVIDDIDMKLELKKADRVALRTVESSILSITMGAEPEKGGINPEALKAMQEIFANETVGRVLVSDYTTKIDFVIPDLNKVLGPEKYQIINEDIANGLNNIFWGEQKFANAMVKIKVFIERLRDGQDVFIEMFLLKEVRRIAKIMGFKSYPRPVFRKIDISDDIEMAKMISRLGELGLITGEETVEAIKTGFLPSPDDVEEAQKKFRDQRQEGLYAPLTGPMPVSLEQQKEQKQEDRDHQMTMKVKADEQKAKQAKLKQAGRPSGTKSKQTTKKVKPIGTGKASTVSMTKLRDVILDGDKLLNSLETKLKAKHGIKKLNDQQKESVQALARDIAVNESRDKWISSIDDYLSGKNEINHEASDAVELMAERFQVSSFSAALLYHSTLNG